MSPSRRPGILDRRPGPGVPALGLLLLALAVPPACAPAEPAGPDLILTGGVVRARGVDADAVAALAIAGGEIVAAGDDVEIRELAGDDTQEMELDGASVLPGFVDAWLDPEAVGRRADGLDVSASATPREVRARVREAAAVDREAPWIVGWGWDETRWPSRELPAADYLDEIQRPVLLYRHDGRVAWINAAAAEAAGITAGDRLPGPDGEPGGAVAGDEALAALEARLPSAPASQRREWIAQGLRRAAAAGYTGALTAPVGSADVALYRRLGRDGDLPVRVGLRLRPDADGAAAPDDLPTLLRIVAVGASLDGPFRPPLAALAGDGADAGLGGLVAETCRAAERLGLPAHFQARGDAAVAATLECPGIASGAGLVVGADLLPQGGTDVLADARVAAVPLRMAHDLYWLDELLGPERAARAHAYADLEAAGRLVGMASAAPAYPLDPMAAVQVTLRRRDREGYPLDGWHPSQRLGIEAAVTAALGPTLPTAGGSLAPGEAADLVVWSTDPFTGSVSELAQARAMLTVVDGRVTFSRPLVELDFDEER